MSNKERWVLQLCHGCGPPFDDVARQWAALLSETPYKVLTVFLTGEKNSSIEDLVGGRVLFLGYKSKDLKGLKRAQIKAVRHLHKEYQFSFAIAHRYKAIYIATHISEIDVIGVGHAYGVYDRLLRKYYVMRHARRLTLVGVSNAIRDDARRALPKFPQEKIQTVYNRINLEKIQKGQISREESRQQFGLEKSDFVVGSVGRLHPDKDQKTLIAAFAAAFDQVPSVKLAVVGRGRLEKELKRQVQELGCAERVVFVGKVPEAWRYFKAFDVFVLSSHFEPFGMVLLEAMAAEVPIISSNCGGAPEVVGDQGLLFNVGDVSKLSSLLREFYKSDIQYRQEITAVLSRRLDKHFTDEAVRNDFWEKPLNKGLLIK
ncbi:MAG: glycosyltransferase involved in cell wall biosynthesis [Porticoccus sp.]|jgi:glycosyltransferase involved in cell wall biosynthesis